jgi:hypothetical protein
MFGLEQGRAYYPLPALVLCVAAGAVAIEGWALRPRLRPAALAALAGLQLLVLLVVAQVVVPVRTTRSMVDLGIWEDTFYKDEIGWPELAGQTAAAWRSLPAAARRNGAILAENCGEAGALALYGPRLGLPPPLSGHLSCQYWRPARLPQRHLLTVGYDPAQLRGFCSDVRVLGRIEDRWRLDNEERGRAIAACMLRRPLGALWDDRIARDEL